MMCWIKYSLISVMLVVVLMGCSQQPQKVTYRYPSDYLLKHCYPERPANANLQDVILIQNSALRQCNDQLFILRKLKENLSD